MTRPDYCPVAQEPCQAMCSMSDVRCKIRDSRPQPKRAWVGLTDEEIEVAYKRAEKKEPYMGAVTRKGIAEEFDRILKEKNT